MECPELHTGLQVEEVEYDMSVDIREVESERALLNAAIQGDYNKIDLLLKSGVSVDAKEYNRLLILASKPFFTPLHLATLCDRDRCVQLLINHGADVNAKDLYGFTSLHFAAHHGALNILKILLRAKAACSQPMRFEHFLPMKYLADTGRYKIPYVSGTTPLHVAAYANNVDCVRELIHYGADYNAVDEYGRTSLYLAAQRGFSECVMVHLKEAMGRDILSLPCYTTFDTPLHFAVKYQFFDCVKELLRLGSDVNHRNFEGLSPLHTALLPRDSNMSDSIAILKLLVLEGYKTDINQPDCEGFTPLHYACFEGHHHMWSRRPEMAKLLITYGADVDIKDSDGTHVLVQELKYYPEENFEILKYLVKNLLHLPRLKSLGITLDTEPKSADEIEQPDLEDPLEDNEEDFDIDDNRLEAADFFSHPHHVPPVANNERSLEFLRLAINRNVQQLVMHRNMRQHDLLMEVYDRFNDHDDDDEEEDDDDNSQNYHHHHNDRVRVSVNHDRHGVNENQDKTELDENDALFLILKKQLWYEEMSSKPRTLMHQSRFVIRKTLGPMRLKYILKMSLPERLRSYLLLELEE